MNKNRFVAYLAEERPYSEYSLEAVLSRQRETMDSIDLKQHDRKYHGGSFNPITMQCQMRRALENGDLADVLSAEAEERLLSHKLFKAACNRVAKDLKSASDDDIALCCCNFQLHTEKRFKSLIRKLYKKAGRDGGGTLIGQIGGLSVYPHYYMDDEIVGSKNAQYLKATDYDVYMDKARIIRHLGEIISNISLVPNREDKHKSNRHRAWMVEKGFWYAPFEFRARPWYFIFTRTADNRLLLYDYVQKRL